MDLQELQGFSDEVFNEHHTFTPKSPSTGEALGFTITVRSMRSDEMVSLMNKTLREMQVKAAKEQRTGKVDPDNLDQVNARNLEMACVLLVRFNNLTDKGEKIGDNAEQNKDILQKNSWLIKQILDEAAEEQNFFKA